MNSEKKERALCLPRRRDRRQPLRPSRSSPVKRPNAALLAVNQSGGAQQLEVMTDRGLILLELWRDVADTQRLRLLDQEIEHAQARRVGERLEPPDERLCFVQGEPWGRSRRAAGSVLSPGWQMAMRCWRAHAGYGTVSIEGCQ